MRFSTNVCRFIPDAALIIPTSTRATTTVTTTTRPPSLLDFDCHFETPCDPWINDRNNRLNWTIITASEGRELSTYAPDTDHTSSADDGSYLTILNATTTVNSSYISPRLNETKCLEFWYYMSGSQVGRLSIVRNEYSSATTSTISTSSTIWSRDSGENQNWQFAQMGYTSYSPRTFTFRVQQYVGSFVPFNVCIKKVSFF